MNLGEWSAKLKEQYDKLLAVVVMLALLLSLIYLAVRIGTIAMLREQFGREMDTLKASHEFAEAVDPSVLNRAMERIASVGSKSRGDDDVPVFVPEARVMCVDCRRPIPYEAEVCPLCGVTQPKEVWERLDYDGDGDGMWDSWERMYGLDPSDPRDALMDMDGDGFLNIEEFRAGTDPTDPMSYPPIETRLALVDIKADPFNLQFKSRIRMPDDSIKFGINTRVGARTYFAGIGEDVEGFVVEAFEDRFEDREVGGARIRTDVSVLTLRRGDTLMHLVLGRDYAYQERVAHLRFALDGQEFRVRAADRFSLRGQDYEAMEIDIARRHILIKRLQDGSKFEIVPRIEPVE